MPQQKAQLSNEGKVKRQALQVLASLERDIEKRKKRLLGLEEEADQIRLILGLPRRSNSGVGRGRSGEPRLDWATVLEQLPDVFSSKQVAALTGKPMEQVYAGVSRWSKDKKIKKTPEGYHKLLPKRKKK